MLAHNVYFTLNDAGEPAQRSLVEACHRYLKDHPGVVFFAAGTLVTDLQRPVNDREFHVGLHVVFRDRRAHDDYQKAESHLRFIEENKANWKQVRVFDSYVR
jgi:hypothetical protein